MGAGHTLSRSLHCVALAPGIWGSGNCALSWVGAPYTERGASSGSGLWSGGTDGESTLPPQPVAALWRVQPEFLGRRIQSLVLRAGLRWPPTVGAVCRACPGSGQLQHRVLGDRHALACEPGNLTRSTRKSSPQATWGVSEQSDLLWLPRLVGQGQGPRRCWRLAEARCWAGACVDGERAGSWEAGGGRPAGRGALQRPALRPMGQALALENSTATGESRPFFCRGRPLISGARAGHRKAAL